VRGSAVRAAARADGLGSVACPTQATAATEPKRTTSFDARWADIHYLADSGRIAVPAY
jgi:hypothetical protein